MPKIPAIADAQTRQRVLEAAGEVFAIHGFRSATVRLICTRARANVAAVNYHFGNKEKLYAAVLEESAKAALTRYPLDGGLPVTAPPEARLRAFCASLLHRVLGHGAPSWHGRLMAREMAEPTFALDPLVDSVIRPQSELLGRILTELMPGAKPQMVWEMTSSVVGQCLFYKHAEAVIRRLQPGWTPDAEQLAEAVTQRTLATLRGMAPSAVPASPAVPVAPSTPSTPSTPNAPALATMPTAVRRAALEKLLGTTKGGRK